MTNLAKKLQAMNVNNTTANAIISMMERETSLSTGKCEGTSANQHAAKGYTHKSNHKPGIFVS